MLRAEHWQDSLLAALLGEIDQVAHHFGARFCIVGATARDLVLHGVHGLEAGSATLDVDFAVAVESWTEFATFRDALLATGRFAAVASQQHQLRYVAGGNYPLDIIPFGGVADSNHRLAWPPDANPVMNLIGYHEVVENALWVDVSGIGVRVASLPGLVLLKLFAWADRWDRTRRDAHDLARVIRCYSRITPNIERLYAEGAALLEHEGHDPDRACIRLLGQDIRSIASTATRQQLCQLLATPQLRNRLIAHLDARDALAHYRVSATDAIHLLERGLNLTTA